MALLESQDDFGLLFGGQIPTSSPIIEEKARKS
jgi:hypothetical protein